MTQEVISFFDNFKCAATECKSNCCKAWDMPVDEKTMEVYANEPGIKGKMRRLTIKNNSSGENVMRTPFGRCCNLSKEKLCKLQLDERTDLMPKVCRLYPRSIVAYGRAKDAVNAAVNDSASADDVKVNQNEPYYVRAMLDLSCIEAAKLFVESDGRLECVGVKEPLEIYWDIDDAYPEFIDFLREDLDKMLDYLWFEYPEPVLPERVFGDLICDDDTPAKVKDADELWRRQKGIFAHAYGVHLKLVRDDLAGAREIGFELGDNIGENDNIPKLVEMREASETDYPYLPMSLINSLMYNKLPETYLGMYHPKMLMLVLNYRRQFGKVLVNNADRAFKGTWDDLCEKYDWLADKIKNYFSYKLQMNYLNAAVDFYVLEPVLLAMLNTQFLMIFIITYCGGKKPLTRAKFAELLSETEKLLSHNTVFCKEAMQEIREELF